MRTTKSTDRRVHEMLRSSLPVLRSFGKAVRDLLPRARSTTPHRKPGHPRLLAEGQMDARAWVAGIVDVITDSRTTEPRAARAHIRGRRAGFPGLPYRNDSPPAIACRPDRSARRASRGNLRRATVAAAFDFHAHEIAPDDSPSPRPPSWPALVRKWNSDGRASELAASFISSMTAKFSTSAPLLTGWCSSPSASTPSTWARSPASLK